LCQAPADEFPRKLEESLKRAGENRPELEKAISVVGSKSDNIKYLINRASQSDLVNLTAQHLNDTVDYAVRVKSEMPWYDGENSIISSCARWAEPFLPFERFYQIANPITYKMWQEYVLPYRVSDEPLSNWRPELYNALVNSVKKAKTSRDAARLVHGWLWSQVRDGKKLVARVQFDTKAGEYRDMAPLQMLASRTGSCFDINLLQVSALRAVGVPARFCVVPYWTGTRDCYHSWVEYWDTTKLDWKTLDANDDSEWLMAASTRLAVAYAMPGYPSETDLFGKEKWDLLTDITENYTDKMASSINKRERLKICVYTEDANFPISATIYTYNYGAWRPVAFRKLVKQETEFLFCTTDDIYPYLVSASIGGKLVWNTVYVSSGEVNRMTFGSLPPPTEESFIFPTKKNPSK
jgi:hypothetical protein